MKQSLLAVFLVGAMGCVVVADLAPEVGNGVTPCGDFVDKPQTCIAGQYCKDATFSKCETGCLSNTNCADNQTCVKTQGDVGSCQNKSNPQPTPQPTPTKNCSGFINKCSACGDTCTQQMCDAVSAACVQCIIDANCADASTKCAAACGATVDPVKEGTPCTASVMCGASQLYCALEKQTGLEYSTQGVCRQSCNMDLDCVSLGVPIACCTLENASTKVCLPRVTCSDGAGVAVCKKAGAACDKNSNCCSGDCRLGGTCR